jgi:hypothetical protein
MTRVIKKIHPGTIASLVVIGIIACLMLVFFISTQGARRIGKGSGTRFQSVGSGEIFFTRRFHEEPLSESELRTGPAILDVKNQVFHIMGKPCTLE